ncbi:MAG TPA: 3-phosphoshikimate 1-carboxyvinyltransferase, partial [Actinomycetota bacterium]|nr:3-phosphoshikimate 1-carboxyvinyltransferase [Actinomycetota bacterium]
MTSLVVRGGVQLSGSVRPPGDKSISHRALMLAACAAGTSRVRGLGPGADIASTRECLGAWGVRAEADGAVDSPGIDAWEVPEVTLDCGNSGTTMRLLAGLAARRPYPSVLDGDVSLRRRPMDRVARPLRALGADVQLLSRDSHPPILVSGGDLRGAEVEMEVASAQVKSAVLLAGLGAEGETTVVERVPTRDHTERLLSWLGV